MSFSGHKYHTFNYFKEFMTVYIQITDYGQHQNSEILVPRPTHKAPTIIKYTRGKSVYISVGPAVVGPTNI